MVIGAKPFAKTARNRPTDVSELSIAQVQPEFFQRIADLDPRVVPAVGTIESFLVFQNLNDIARMLQGKTEFMTLHRENTAQAMGCGLRRGCEVRGVGHQA